jgi:hypothetical protein
MQTNKFFEHLTSAILSSSLMTSRVQRYMKLVELGMPQTELKAVTMAQITVLS